MGRHIRTRAAPLAPRSPTGTTRRLSLNRFLAIDLDDTLIDTQAALRSWVAEYRNFRDIDDDQVELVWQLKREARGDYYAFGQLLLDARISDVAPELFATELRAAVATRVEPFPGTVDRLFQLRSAGVWVSVVTNGLTSQQLPRILNAGLDPFIDDWVTSEMAGAPKPDPDSLVLAWERSSFDEADRWVIGDSWKDIVGATAAGMRSLLVSGDQRWDEQGEAEPDATFETTADALAFLVDRWIEDDK